MRNNWLNRQEESWCSGFLWAVLTILFLLFAVVGIPMLIDFGVQILKS
jgi:hypothetical protein